MARYTNTNFWRKTTGRGKDSSPSATYYPESKKYVGGSSGPKAHAFVAFSESQSQGNTFIYPQSSSPVSGLAFFDGKLYIPELLAAENAIISGIERLLRFEAEPIRVSAPATFAPRQSEAFNLAFSSPISIITGGPGTGKTTVSAAIIHKASNLGLEPLAMAPTGKAAKRMEEALEGYLKPSTIHRGLAWSMGDDTEEKNGKDNIGGGPRFNPQNPLPSKFLLIDECSMIDLPLMAYLLDAVASDTRIVFVGDPDQLPPVGPGQPFLDFIRSGIIPVVTLTTIFRQAEGGGISMACKAIKDGNPSDFFNSAEGSPEITLLEERDTLKSICHLAKSMSPELQVLSPKKDTSAILNRELSPILNTTSQSGDSIYSSIPLSFDLMGRSGDRIQQIKNNYFKEVFNGDQGILENVGFHRIVLNVIKRGRGIQTFSSWPKGDELGSSEFCAKALLSDVSIPYIPDEAVKELMLAYAITIHRSQGSEWGEVAIDVTPQAYGFFSRRLFFTALSRAKRHAYIVGEPSLIAKAILTNRDDLRRTALAERLKEIK